MKVVFLEDVEGVAQGGDIKEVKNGFARNYLIPKQLAAPATHNYLQKIEKLKKNASDVRVKRLDGMKEIASAIDNTRINIEMRASLSGRLYGSVTGTMVADAITLETGQNIERRLVQLDNPIRELGAFDVPVRFHSDVLATVKVTVHSTEENLTDLEDLEETNIDDKLVKDDQVIVDSAPTAEASDSTSTEEDENKVSKEND